MRTLVRCCYCVTLATVLAVLCLGLDHMTAWASSGTTITVINTNDAGAGSLRNAINFANSNPPPVLIQFAIPPFSNTVKVITLSNALPAIASSSVTLDGYTQANSSPNTLSNGDNAVLLIELDGSLMQSRNIFGDALTVGVGGDNCTVRGLVVNRLGFVGSGIVVNGNGNTIEGNFVGTDPTGASGLGNEAGVVVNGNANIVGGTSADARNIVSGNSEEGIFIAGNNNVAQGNFVGTDYTGTNIVADQSGGVVVAGANNTVGGVAAGAGNLISGNGFDGEGDGIDIDGSNDVVQGNWIGVDSTGRNSLGNQGDGVYVDGTFSTIGGTSAGAGNVISDNGFFGIELAGNGNTVQGNLIGTDASGVNALGNFDDGVTVSASSNTVGGTTASARNIISGNEGDGVSLSGDTVAANTVQGNFVGADMTGVQVLGNTGDGVLLDGVSSNTIGGATSGSGNVISGNGGNGIDIIGEDNFGAAFNVIQGNFIGTDVTGTRNLSNSLSGVLIQGIDGEAIRNLLGGTNSGDGNVIIFNGSNGVTVVGGNAFGDSILGNSIFTNAALGIDLGADGVTSNQTSFGEGPNDLQNIPILISATCSNGSTVVQGTTRGTGSATSMRIEFFANAACDPSGYGEGENFVGFVDVTLSFTNSVPFEVLLSSTDLEGLFITATATDDSGNTSEFSKCLQVTKIPPVITQCATSMVATADANCQATVPDFAAQVQATDNCTPSNLLVISQSPTNGAIVGMGVTDVTITVADSSTNTTSCSVTFTVLDKTPPTIACPAPLTLQCASEVPAPQPSSVVATDTCSAVTVTFISDTITNQTCTNRFTLIRTYRATDSSSNTADCTQVITVNSTTPPTITCPADVTANTDPGQCSASGVVLGTATASSNCGDAVTVTNAAPSTFPKGTNAVVWTATDSCGDASTCTQQVIVVDNQPPTFVTISSITVTGALGSVSNAVTFASPAATDNCSTSVTVVCTPPSGSFFAYGTNTVACVATDASGNTSSNSFHVIVVRPIGPDLTGQWIATTTFSRGGNNFVFGAFQVINQGKAPAGKSLLQFYRSTTSSTNGGTLLTTQFIIGQLNAGQAHSISIFGLKLPSGVSGTNQFLIAVTDASRVVPESDEANNVISTNPPALFTTAGAALTRFHKTIREAREKH